MFVTEQGFKLKEGDGAGAKRAIEYLPFDDDRMLATAASLNGGNVLAAFIRTLQVNFFVLKSGGLFIIYVSQTTKYCSVSSVIRQEGMQLATNHPIIF